MVVLLLFIDVDGDGTCTPDVDDVYSDFRFLTDDLTLMLSDSVPSPVAEVSMHPPFDAADVVHSCADLNSPWPDS